jgi:hypothetical protein
MKQPTKQQPATTNKAPEQKNQTQKPFSSNKGAPKPPKK